MHKQNSTLSRQEWVSLIWTLSEPVLKNSAKKELKINIPVFNGGAINRKNFSHLEAVGRTFAGISPWLELDDLQGDEASLQFRARELAQKTIASITDPDSPDFLNFNQGNQPVVDAAYLAQSILRAPKVLWSQLSQNTKQHLFDALVSTRKIKPYFNNWLLFSAMIEAFFCKIGAPFDAMRIDYALRQVDQWYVGDGMYSDGPEYHNDYYNSYVIHPFLLDISNATGRAHEWKDFEPVFLKRAQRYAEVLERMISPEGTMPVLGRSISYRCGNLHALAQLALIKKLPDTFKPAQIRCAMSAVIARTLTPKNTFDNNGWLNAGLCGLQPSLAEGYISTGSLYLATLAFLPLGLPPNSSFWADPDALYTSQSIYSGLDIEPDIALKE
jgi:hypothetical protein